MRHENERNISGVGASPPAGESPTVVARILGVLATTVHRWRRLANLAAWDAKALCEQVVEALIDLAYRPGRATRMPFHAAILGQHRPGTVRPVAGSPLDPGGLQGGQ
jgi:hypothetical protein